jgi:ribosome-binding ATPase YchF (GTP1/OBG family)
VAVSARLESELSDLDEEEAAGMRSELEIPEPALDRVVRGAYDLLHLIAFFTADTGKPAMSRHVTRGSTAYQAAGAIHTDIQRGFVRAEVIAWDELVDAGSYAAARDRGTLRVEGRDYVVADGDVVHVRFSP